MVVTNQNGLDVEQRKISPANLRKELVRRVNALDIPAEGFTPEWFKNIRTLYALLQQSIGFDEGLVINFRSILKEATPMARKVWMYREVLLELDVTMDHIDRFCRDDDVEFGVVEPSMPEKFQNRIKRSKVVH
jgi:hypothetical protein